MQKGGIVNNILFITECKDKLNKQDLLFLRNLYTTIIGRDAILLYQILIDYDYINSEKGTSFFELKDLENTLLMSSEAVVNAKVKLEAVGLIRTFENQDSNKLIFIINKPLNPVNFRNNSILYNKLINGIGDELFERIEFSTKTKKFSKENFKETTSKFQDIFEIETIKEDSNVNTLEINLPAIKDKESAVKGLNSFQFISYVTSDKINESHLLMVQSIMRMGFCSQSINLIINYSFDKNKKIVLNHIKKIAEDMFKKNIFGPAPPKTNSLGP